MRRCIQTCWLETIGDEQDRSKNMAVNCHLFHSGKISIISMPSACHACIGRRHKRHTEVLYEAGPNLEILNLNCNLRFFEFASLSAQKQFSQHLSDRLRTQQLIATFATVPECRLVEASPCRCPETMTRSSTVYEVSQVRAVPGRPQLRAAAYSDGKGELQRDGLLQTG